MTIHEARQRRQRGLNKVKSHRNYMKNRAKNKLRARKRYRKVRNTSGFKRHQHIYQMNPNRFKRFGSENFQPIPFWSDAIGMGVVVGADPTSVFYLLGTDPGTILSMYPQDLLDTAVFFSEDGIDRFFALLDTVTDTPVAVSAVSDAIVRSIENGELRQEIFG